MNRLRLLGRLGIVICVLVACSPKATETAPTDTSEPTALPLSEPGPYRVGLRKVTVTDPARNDREVTITFWYPAKPSEGSASSGFLRDADPDPREAPYPLILSSSTVAGIFAKYAVSHGFTWASVDKIAAYPKMNENMIDQPLDILFALNQAASNPPDGLEGIIDAEHAGAVGYSFDGYNSLALSGARINPEYYLAQCPTPDAITGPIVTHQFSAFDCSPADAWADFADHAGESITTSEDGLWQPMTDEQIRAVIPMAAEGWWLFGEKGLATENRPVLMIAGSQDQLYAENALIFEHLGSPDKTMITFINQDHGMVFLPDLEARMAHFMIAFFGYHLQGHKDFSRYFSKDFVSQFDYLAWGVYEK